MTGYSGSMNASGIVNGFVFPGKLSELLYFAYGADMNGEQLALRGVRPAVVSIARLPGHRVEFFGYSRTWDGGMETVVTSPGADVWGVLYQLSFQDGEVLDVWQDARQDGGGAYFHYPTEVIDKDGRGHLVLLYKKDVLGAPQPPSRDYLEFVVQGAVERGLPASYVNELRQKASKAAEFPVPRRGKFSRAFLAGGCAECSGAL
ncbi:gamma-glutamylcyclotransferase family protein [Geminisphaera colitermitum]|uniref:gamma-glutamylcyclotransferase family protein n=1 Tax=Geminisphaera colitermitum TaxID=1148786 RepID=UPI000158CD75|nr:gamma-glutamylcyclotransferase family protein [Geminisphaera colitermitum]